MSASAASACKYISGGHMPRLQFCLALTIAVFIFVSPSEIAQAVVNTNPGDQYAFGVDAPVFANGSQQNNPALNGNIVVWSEYDPVMPGYYRIYYKDLSKGDKEQGHALVSNDYGGGMPAISATNQGKNRVVWSDWNGATLQSQLYYKDIDFSTYSGCSGSVSSCANVLPAAGDQLQNLSISPDASKLAWQQGGGNYPWVYVYDFNTGVAQPLDPVAARTEERPMIDNNWVVWTERWDYSDLSHARNWAIYAKNLNGSNLTVTVAQNDGTVATSVKSASLGRDAAGREVVAYVKNDNSLVLHYLDNGADIQLDGGNGIDQLNMDADKIVYSAFESGGRKIHLYDITSNVSQTVSTGTADYLPRVSASSKYIVWQNRATSPPEIFYNRCETAQVLADRYKPVLKLAGNENFEPMPVEQVLTAPGTFLKKKNDSSFQALRNPSAHDLAAYAQYSDLYIDFLGSSIEAGGGILSRDNPTLSTNYPLVGKWYVTPYQNRKNQFPETIYSRVVSRPAGNTNSFIQYWLFYYANDHPEDFHEGDWELVQVDLNGNLDPYRTDYSQHGHGKWRNWPSDAGTKTHPVVYVAHGSHANYYYSGDHPIDWMGNGSSSIPRVWDTAPGDGHILNDPKNADPAMNTSVTVVPETDRSLGSPFEWLNYPGQWGEYTGANIGVWPTPQFSGFRDGADNPPTQPYWNNAFAWDKNICDGCQDQTAQQTDAEVTVLSPVDIRIYDSSNRVMGKNLSPTDVPIPGAEYFEYPDLHRKSIIIHWGDINQGYRIEAVGNGTGPASFIVTAPDHPGGKVDTLNYNAISVNPSTKITMSLNATKNYTMAIDTNGDGTSVIQKAPDTTTTNIVDFTPPAAVTNLAVTSTGSGSAMVSFTAPGDDGNLGTAKAYDLRYSRSAVTDQYWSDATPAGNLPTPLAAGSTQTATVSGLDAGTTYYFAIKAIDKVDLYSPISNIVTGTTTIPSLTWSKQRVYWASWADYQNRQLSIDYKLSNTGTGTAVAPTIAASICNPSTVYVTTPLPLPTGDLSPNTSSLITLKYYVPPTVGSFTTTTYASCKDDAGRTYWFPGPLP